MQTFLLKFQPHQGKIKTNTPESRGGPGGRDRTLAVKNQKNKKKCLFLHISSSYATILGETNVHPREFPRRGSKTKDIIERERKREKSESR